MDIETLINESQDIGRRSGDMSQRAGANAAALANGAQSIQTLTQGSRSGAIAASSVMEAARVLKAVSASTLEMQRLAEAYAKELMK